MSSTEVITKERWSDSWYGVFAMFSIVGMLVSFLFLVHSPTNYQERFNLNFAMNGNLNPTTQGSPDDPMPLYYVFLHGIAHITTPSLTLLRSVSVICLVLAFVVIYFAGKFAHNYRTGLLAATMTALSPFMLWYANRATVYSLLVLVTVLNQLCFVLLLHKKNWVWPLYIVSAILGLGLHYFFIFILLLQFAFFFAKRRDFSTAYQVGMALTAVGLFAIFTAWIHYLSDVINVFKLLPYAGKPSATNAFIIYVQYLFGFQSVTTTTLIIAFWPLLVVLALLAVQKYVRPSIGIQYFAFTTTMLIVTLFVFSWIWRSLFLSSYLIIGLPSFMLMVSWYLVAFDLKVLASVRVIVLGVMVVMLAVELSHTDFALSQDYLGSVSSQPRTAEVMGL
ncbi:MAG TPA: glycosyltransferase family 39 protein [Candidatus Microsaccharimonas sp.]|nr:glycosyltransferase family 39 protein [Candidatus Microsaccharimonas sp.]